MKVRTPLPLPLNQIAFSVIDLKRTERWWREGLGFLPSGGSRLLFRGPLISAIQGLPKAAMTCWCLLGRNDWCQIEMFQHESPIAKLMPEDFMPNDIGYTRCGVWVQDFDGALARLAKLDTQPLAAPLGEHGKRRVCVRNPDGVFVELMEDDPLPEQNRLGRQDCPVALRYATLSTPDMAGSLAFLKDGLDMPDTDIVLHGDEHEALWGLAGAHCTRKVIGGPTLLLEVVEYRDPKGKPRRPGYRICDQGILNICFGDPLDKHGVNAMYRKALEAGAKPNSRPIHTPFAGCVYVNDPLGFSYEFMWCSPGLGHREYGFTILPEDKRPPPDNQLAIASVWVPLPQEQVFAMVNDNASLSQWSGMGRFSNALPGSPESGVGAERNVALSIGAVREQIIDWQPGKSVRYRIIKGSPFVNYIGEIALSAEANGTRVIWSSRLRSRIPGLGGLFRRIVQSKLNGALQGLQKHADSATHALRH